MSQVDLLKPDLLRQGIFINGEWKHSANTFDVEDPATEEKIVGVSAGTTQDVKDAIAAAQTAFRSFKKTTGRYRSDLLRSWATQLRENVEDLGKIMSLENGKPLAEAKGEIIACALHLEWFSEEAPHYTGDTILSQNPSTRLQTWRQPVGVCGVITPWNFPALMIARKVGAALGVGCTTVIKPASETPLSALALVFLSQKAGIPPGVINIVPGSLEDTAMLAKELCENPSVKKLTFTGSTRVGKILMEQTASSVKKVTFELGGNAPFIVFNDADVEKAAVAAVASRFRGSGQVCVSANRFYVQEKVYDEFIQRFSEEIAKLRPGPGLVEGSTQGPLISRRGHDKVKELTEDAVAKGAKVVLGGHSLPHIGPLFFEPTLLSHGKKGMKIFSEEAFGPLAAVAKFKDEEEVVELANDTEVGLAGYFFTNDISTMYRVAEELEVGMVGVNTGFITEAAVPFGGIKESGFGREGSKYAFDDFTYIKAVGISI